MILLVTLVCMYTTFWNPCIKYSILKPVAIFKMFHACNNVNLKQIKELLNYKRETNQFEQLKKDKS